MRGNSQNGGQTTKSLLIKPQCSGVPIQQAVSLSSSFPRHCLLFVCAFFPEMPESARSEELPLLPPPAYKTAPASCYGNRGGSFALWVLFSGIHAKPCEGSFGKPRVCGEKILCFFHGLGLPGSPPHMRGKGPASAGSVFPQRITPAYAGKSFTRQGSLTLDPDHPRVCGEKVVYSVCKEIAPGSPPRVRGKGHLTLAVSHMHRINPAYAGKRSRCSWGCTHSGDHPRVCGEKSCSRSIIMRRKGSPPRTRGKD